MVQIHPPLPLSSFRGVAQPGSAVALGATGRRFESCRPDQHTSSTPSLVVALYTERMKIVLLCALLLSSCSFRPSPPRPVNPWSPVPAATSHFVFSGDLPGYKVEQIAAHVPLPITYRFDDLVPIPGGGVQRTTCPLQNRTSPRPVFWFAGEQSIANLFPSPAAQMFDLYDVGQRVSGFTFEGQFPQTVVDGGYPVAAVFYTDRFCTDAGREFGFAQFLWEGTTHFYFSDFTNCEGEYCRINDSGARDVYARPDIFSVQINGLPEKPLRYRARVTPVRESPRTITVEVLDGDALTTCSFGTGMAVPCRAVFPIIGANPASFYGYGDLENGYFNGQDGAGYIATVIQASGVSSFPAAEAMEIQALSVAR